jgi:S-adenosylmethionine-diacylglycerol 3-amino-3-carboxypropyl transferase
MTAARATAGQPDPFLLVNAVHRHRRFSIAGLRERMFTWAFRDLVYAQIWEDPVVDMQALELQPESRVVAIASGGCNLLSYLIANPAHIQGVDLNAAHVALNKLKLAALTELPDYDAFYRFVGQADLPSNIGTFERSLAPHLDPATRSYWNQRDRLGRRRISAFSRNIYRAGLLGRFIGVAHVLAKQYGVDPRLLLTVRSKAQMEVRFDREIAPIFDKPLVKRLLDNPASLYGLGIPPAQYKELAGDAPGMATVVRARLRKLLCDFELSDNYFAWQALARGYRPDGEGPLPPYLQRENFADVRDRARRIDVHQISMTTYLAAQSSRSLDRYVLLDAQDWMTPVQLNALWAEITRTARPASRVIFRTAGEASMLPEKLDPALLQQWSYADAQSRDLFKQDRSAIYGGFHLYIKAA